MKVSNLWSSELLLFYFYYFLSLHKGDISLCVLEHKNIIQERGRNVVGLVLRAE